jgi:hypothetical protein
MTRSLSALLQNPHKTPFNLRLKRATRSSNLRARAKFRLAKRSSSTYAIPQISYRTPKSEPIDSASATFFRFISRGTGRSGYPQLKNVTRFTSLQLGQLRALLSLTANASVSTHTLSTFYETVAHAYGNFATLGAGPTRCVDLKSRFMSAVNPVQSTSVTAGLGGRSSGLQLQSFNFFAQFQTYTAASPHVAMVPTMLCFPEWSVFCKFAKQLSMRRELASLNLARKARENRYYSFYSYRLKPTKARIYAMRTTLPKLTKTPRGSLWVTPLSPESGSAESTIWEYDPALELAPALPPTRTAVTAVIASGRIAPRPRTRLPSLLNRTRRKLARFSRRSHGVVRYLLRKLKRLDRRIAKRSKRFSRFTKRRMTLFNRAARKFVKRSGLLAYLPRAAKSLKSRKSLLHFATPKAKNRAKGVFFRAHELVRRKIRVLTSPNYRPLVKAWLASLILRSPSPFRTPRVQTSNPSPTTPPRLGKRTTWSNSLITFIHSYSFADATVFKFLLAQLVLNSPSGLSTAPFAPTHSQLQHLAFRIQNQIAAYGYSKDSKPLLLSNLWVTPKANYSIRRKLLRVVSSNLFSVDLSFWYYKTLTQFIENCSGRKSLLYFGPFIEKALTFEDQARCLLWNNRVTGFQRMMGHRIFVYEALSIVAMSIRLKDPTFLSNWIRGMLKRLSFWKYRLIFRYLKFLLRHVFRPNFHLFDFRGVKLRLKGKISVAGNARTRTLFLRVGDTSHSKANNRVAYDLSYIHTFTGVMGFKLWFFH